MGREWLSWVGGLSGGGRGGGDGGGRSGRSCTKRGRMPWEMKERATSAGCMRAVFHLFHLHNFQFPSNQHNDSDFHPNNYPFLQEEATTSKGLEAPRNSLELQEASSMNAASISILAMKDDDNFNFPVGIQIKTSHVKTSSPRLSTCASKSRIDDFSSECSSNTNSPATKTPSVVARLMGLDLLPECNSPTISSSSPQPGHAESRLQQRKDRDLPHGRSKSRGFFVDDIGVGARSLRETPRISSARRSDVEYHRHRLSLQINKEEFALSDRRGRLRATTTQDENTSPGQYAKQIAKHVEDSVSRRGGLDITNTINRNREQSRGDENLILTRKDSKILSRFGGENVRSDTKQSNTTSRSPRLAFLDANKNKNNATTNSITKSPRISSSSDNYDRSRAITNSLKPKPQVNIFPLQEHLSKKIVGGCGKCSSSRLKKLTPQASDHAIKNKKDESFARSKTATNKLNLTDYKSKKASLSRGILNISGSPILQVKKGPSPPPTKLPQKQSQVSDAVSKSSTQLPSRPSQLYNQLQVQTDKIFTFTETVSPGTTNGCATALRGGASAEYGKYIERILKLAGIINKVNPLALNKWHTPSQPIDPSTFHLVELFLTTTTTNSGPAAAECNSVLNQRCNRMLIFQLVNELLAETLTAHFNLHAWISTVSENDHFPLVDELCKKIDEFPAASCLVLEDIDSLIDKDMIKSRLNGFFNEEENIVCEIEDEIVECLLLEMVAEMGGNAAEEETETDRCDVGRCH